MSLEQVPGLWRLRVFGPIAVVDPNGNEHRPTTPKVAELLAFLSLRRHSTTSRDAIAAAIWPDAESGRDRLKQTLALLRKQIPGLPIRALGKHEIEFPFDQISVDMREYAERHRWIALLSGQRRVDAVGQLLDVTKDPVLPGVAAGWAKAEREHWRRIRESLHGETGESEANVLRFVDELPGTDVPLIGREAALRAARTPFESCQTRGSGAKSPSR